MKITLYNAQQGHKAIQEVWAQAKAALVAGKRLELTITEQTRSSEQNRRLWSLLTDISQQVDWHGQKLSPDDWKHILTASLVKQRAVPGVDGGFVVLGQSTSKMTVSEMSELQSLIEAFGAQQGVTFLAVE